MSLEKLEAVIAERGMVCQRSRDGSLVWPIQGRYGTHPVIFIDEQGGYMSGSVSFPIPRVPDLEGLCREIGTWLPKEAVLSVSGNQRMISVASFVTLRRAQAGAHFLSGISDRMAVLTAHLREYKRWDNMLVTLAFLEDQYFFK